MELRRERFTTEYLDPRRAFEPTRAEVEVRFDPLTGRSARLLPEGSLPPPAPQDVDALAEQTRSTCPFCGERVERETPRFLPNVHAQGRIRVGEALLFPNLVPYAKWSSVSVYSPARHVLRLDEFSPQLIRDNVSAQVEFGRAVRAHDPASRFVSINANHLPPSGSSIFHPHLQGVANPVPTTTHRVFAELSAERLRDYLNVEREAGERIVASLDDTTWLAAFAPSGLAELRALVPDAGSAVDLDRGRIAAVAAGISAVLRIYAQLGFQSFNLAMHEAADFVMVRVVARATFGPLHRSDTMWSEHLHSETVTDLSPERVADLARQAF